MNFWKKTASFLLVMVMVLAMSVSAFAAGETGSITVENPIAGQTYTAYKIFDVEYNADRTAYSYTIDADSEWLSVVQSYGGVTLSDVITDEDGRTFYVVTENSSFAAGAFSALLKENMSGKTGTALSQAEDGTVSASGLELGYYFVASTSGALCNLTTTMPDATIRDKNDITFEKTAEDISVELGQTEVYTIACAVPDTTGFLDYTYVITDTMSDGLTFRKDVKVTIGGLDVTESCEITYDVEGNDNSFSLKIPLLDESGVALYGAGTAILVEYTAIVNSNAIAQVEENSAVLEYTNNPDGSTTTTPPEVVEIYSARIVIDKYVAGGESEKLSGARFVLYKETEVTEGEGDEAVTSTVRSYYKIAEEVVSWVGTRGDATVVTTDENGAASFDGLEDGAYYLEEIQAPTGYNMLDEPVEVTVAGGTAETDVLSYEVDVPNSAGSVLPETGGAGTTVFYVLGGVLLAGAAMLLLGRRRRGMHS